MLEVARNAKCSAIIFSAFWSCGRFFVQYLGMSIRRTQTRNRISGEPYVTYRLVHSTRVGNAIKQTTLLNLGAHFDLPQVHWPALAQHIDELVHGQRSMLDTTLPEEVQVFAQRFAAQIIARTPAVPSPGPVSAAPAAPVAPASAQPLASPRNGPGGSTYGAASEVGEQARYQEIDLDSLELVDPRSVGVEHAALSAMRQCGFQDKLSELGLNRPQIAAAVGNIVARMAQPGSELATHAWLKDTSGLGELIDFDFEKMDLSRLYRASDALYKHRDALQEHLFGKACSMFGLGQTITLYDLSNTYFEGVASGVSKAKRGHSKECRSDCPLVSSFISLRQHRERPGAPRARRQPQRCPQAGRGLATPRPGMPGCSNAARLLKPDTRAC